MRIRTRGYAAAAGLAVLALVATACGGSSGSPSSGSSSSGSGSQAFGLQGVNPGTGTPTKGGTLNMLGQGDVDFMDYNVSYYTIGALGQRMWLRLLYAYPADAGQGDHGRAGPGYCPADDHQRREDLLGDDPYRRGLGHQPGAAGDGG